MSEKGLGIKGETIKEREKVEIKNRRKGGKTEERIKRDERDR